MKIKNDDIIRLSQGNIVMNKLPEVQRKALVSFFIKLCNLIVDETNILTITMNNNKRIVATNEHLATYFGFKKGTIIQNMTELVRLNVLMKCKVNTAGFYIVNPEYCHYKDGVYDTVLHIFKDINAETVVSKIKKVYTKELKAIKLNK